MIPPLQPSRLRMIASWLQSNPDPEAAKPPSSEELSRRARAMDERMMEEFDSRTSLLQEQMMQRKDWGTEAATAEFRTAELEAWNAVVSEFLPATTEPQSEP